MPLPTHFTTIPDMVHNSLSSPEHLKTNYAMSFHTDISPEDVLDVMSLEHVEHKGLVSGKTQRAMLAVKILDAWLGRHPLITNGIAQGLTACPRDNLVERAAAIKYQGLPLLH